MKILWRKLILSEVLCFLPGVLGSIFTFSQITSWYAGLHKPFFTPPNALFGPVWTILYFLQGVSFYLIWKGRIKTRQIRLGLLFFFIQLLLNALWSILFFGFHAVGLAILDIIGLWIFIFLVILSFAKVSKVASWILVPYLVWVTYAGLLTIGIFLLNK